MFGGEHFVSRDRAGQTTWNTLFVCRFCRDGVVAVVQGKTSSNHPSTYDGELRTEGFTVLAVHPKPQPLDIPKHLPEEIAVHYREAVDTLRHRNFIAAGMVFRKVLQLATTALATDVKRATDVEDEGSKTESIADWFRRKKLKLGQRVDALADQNLITPAMRDWADQIRIDGNEATHGEEKPFTQTDSEQMKAFTEVFLMYAFTLPESVKLARGTSTNTDQSA